MFPVTRFGEKKPPTKPSIPLPKAKKISELAAITSLPVAKPPSSSSSLETTDTIKKPAKRKEADRESEALPKKQKKKDKEEEAPEDASSSSSTSQQTGKKNKKQNKSNSGEEEESTDVKVSKREQQKMEEALKRIEAEGGDVEGKGENGEGKPKPNKKKPKKEGKKSEKTDDRPRWMREGRSIKDSFVPVTSLKLHPAIMRGLADMNIVNLFPAQFAAIPAAVRQYSGCDICVSAPTGSGKTLSYVLPIVQALANRVVPRLRALVMVPSRDLALQVHRVFMPFCSALGLKVECVIGQRSFNDEQIHLRSASAAKTGVIGVARQEKAGTVDVDIIVATPGRLMDHLQATEGFSLQHLQFLVVDEADRLMSQSYQNWLPKVLAKTIRPSGVLHSNSAPPLKKMIFSATLTHNPQKLASLGLHNPMFFSNTQLPEQLAKAQRERENAEAEVKKLKKSEVMEDEEVEKKGEEEEGEEQAKESRDAAVEDIATPRKEKEFRTPDSLKEYELVCDATHKPAVLCALLAALSHIKGGIVVFTKSKEGTHRLCRVLEIGGISCREFSSMLNQKLRTHLLQLFATGKVKVLVCSDAVARGLDMPNIDVVVNYDTPTYIKTYIHRVGRTARAGREGLAITLLAQKEVRYFHKLLKQAETNLLGGYPLHVSEVEKLLPAYKVWLQTVKILLRQEERGEVKAGMALTARERERLSQLVLPNSPKPIDATNDQEAATNVDDDEEDDNDDDEDEGDAEQ